MFLFLVLLSSALFFLLRSCSTENEMGHGKLAVKFICITSVLSFVKHFVGSVQTALQLLDWTTEFLLDSSKLAATQCLVQCRKEAKATSQEFLEVKGHKSI